MDARRIVALLGLATAALAPVAMSQAASLPTIDVWTGKTARRQYVSIYNVRGRKAVQVSLNVSCLTTDGRKATLVLASDARLSGGGVTVNQRNATGDRTQDATFRLKARLPKTGAATGTASWTMAASDAYQACSGRDTFRVRHTISHGG